MSNLTSTRARKPPVATPVKYPVFDFKWRHRTFKIYTERNGLLRARSRAGDLCFDFTLEAKKFKPAVIEARAELEKKFSTGFAAPAVKSKGSTNVSLAQLIAVYNDIPKGCSKESARQYVNAITCIARQTWGKEPEAVPVADFIPLCPAYVSMKQAEEIPNAAHRPDYNTRRSINRTISSMLRLARCLFIPELHNDYRARGIVLPAGIENVRFPRELRKIQSDLDDKGMLAAWVLLRESDPSTYAAVGLARFVGLRCKEVMSCRGSWIVKTGDGVFVEVRDREDEGFRTKTDVETYFPQVVHAGFADFLISSAKSPADRIVGNPEPAWERNGPQVWLRQFTDAIKPLHRLRAEYAMQVKKEHVHSIMADMEGTEAASRGLGHSNSKVTKKSYLNHKRPQ